VGCFSRWDNKYINPRDREKKETNERTKEVSTTQQDKETRNRTRKKDKTTGQDGKPGFLG
jgi:hypothetical protein